MFREILAIILCCMLLSMCNYSGTPGRIDTFMVQNIGHFIHDIKEGAQ